MLPVKLSTGLTSLNFGEERLAVIIDMVIAENGELVSSDIYRAVVRNQAKLAYHSVAAWLEGTGSLPRAAEAVSGLSESLRLQDRIAQDMKSLRHEHGALTLETIEVKPLFEQNQIRELEIEEKDRAKDIIENFMIAANGVTARYLASKNYPSIRRVVRQPKRWDRIVEVAAEHGYSLPDEPDSRALENFLNLQQKKDPLRFPDLSLVVIKLLGSGEYIADLPGETTPGHFGLAVKDYSHSTAPNRRFTDLITQRLLKAALQNQPAPYAPRELEALAKHCTEQEDAANKVERRVSKSAAALLIEHRIGETFDGIITGAADKGTWVRLLELPVEGKLVRGFQGLDVGQNVRVRLDSVDVEEGFIDFSYAKRSQKS
jgi:exoribonuclease-2